MTTTISEYTAAVEGDLQAVAERLAVLIDANAPGLEGKLWQAQPVWMDGKTPVIGFKAFPRWVTLMIWNRAGAPAVEDATGTLEAGARMCTRRFARADEIDEAVIAGWVRQVAPVPAGETV
ncbi:MAG: DUF1801 domain-containing protein [Thermomicrobiales bacterium]